MSVEETVKVLRAISQDYENSNDGTSFDVCGECKNAADQLERLNDFEQSQSMKLLEKIAEKNDVIHELQTENERLKSEKPVRCGECKHYEYSEEKGVLSHCVNHGGVLMSLNTVTGLAPTDYCSYGERRDAE